jgi:hypothetical protein
MSDDMATETHRILHYTVFWKVCLIALKACQFPIITSHVLLPDVWSSILNLRVPEAAVN